MNIFTKPVTEAYDLTDATWEIIIILLVAFILGWLFHYFWSKMAEGEVVIDTAIPEKFARLKQDDLKLVEGVGPKIEELAKKGKNLIELPYTVKGMDIQLGGLYTYIKNLLERENVSKEDLAFSIQEHVFSMLAEISERALAHLGKKEFVLTGGVAANKRLQEILRKMCEERNIKFGTVPMDLANDNGAMIAWTGIVWKKNNIKGLDNINPYWRPEEIEY